MAGCRALAKKYDCGRQDEDLFFVVTAKYTLLNQLILILLNHPHASIFRQAC